MSAPPAILPLVLALCTAIGGARQALYELAHTAPLEDGHWHLCFTPFGGLEQEHHHHLHHHDHDHDHVTPGDDAPGPGDCGDCDPDCEDDDPGSHRAPVDPEFVPASAVPSPVAAAPAPAPPAWIAARREHAVRAADVRRPPARAGPHHPDHLHRISTVVLRV